MSDPLENLARRAEGDPFFLASVLAEYARGERLDDAGLAAALGCRPGDLTVIRLCRAPRDEPRGFREDVERVAGRFGIEPVRLAEVVRRGESLRRLRGPAPAGDGFLMAARDAEGPAEGGPPKEEGS